MRTRKDTAKQASAAGEGPHLKVEALVGLVLNNGIGRCCLEVRVRRVVPDADKSTRERRRARDFEAAAPGRQHQSSAGARVQFIHAYLEKAAQQMASTMKNA